MRSLLALFLFLVAGLSFAQTVTVVVVTPQRPVDCKTENGRLVNWVYDLKTISESEDEAVVQFTTQYGQCVSGRTSPFAIDPSQANAYAYRDGFVWPWQKEGIRTNLAAYSDSEMLVTLTFDKNAIFRKRPENHFTFHFEPGIRAPQQIYRDRNGYLQVWSPRYQFPWNIDVYLDGETEAEQVLRVQIR